MNFAFRFRLAAAFAALAALPACHNTCPQPASDDLMGTWQLTSHLCYCAPAPLPNETVTFQGQSFTFSRNGQVERTGTFTQVQAAPQCLGSAGPVPTLRLEFAPTSNLAPQAAQITISGNTLTLDYGSPCDAPLDTYKRVNP